MADIIQGSDGRNYRRVGAKYVPVDSVENPMEPPQPGRMPGIGGAVMEGVNAFNRSVLDTADFLTAGQLGLADKAGQYGIGSQAGYMDPGTARDVVQGFGTAAPAAGMLAAAPARNLASLGGALAEFAGFGTGGTGTQIAGQIADTATSVPRAISDAVDVGMGGGRMSNRVLKQVEGAVTAGGDDARRLQGFPTLDELRAANRPLTYGDELALTARNADEIQHARRVREAEELKRSDPVRGGEINAIRDQQKDWATSAVKDRLGIQGDVALTDDVLGQTLNRLGGEFDQYADDIGSITIGDDVLAQLDEVLELAGSTSEGVIGKIIDDIKKFSANNDGALSGQDWQKIRTRLGKLTERAGKQGDQGRMADAVDIQEIMTDVMESQLPELSREAMQQTRARYALTKSLLKRAGNLSADGEVNPRSLYGALRSQSAIRRGDPLLKEMEALRFLTDRVLPTSGTMERMIANPGKAVVQTAIGTGVLGGVGSGVNSLLD